METNDSVGPTTPTHAAALHLHHGHGALSLQEDKIMESPMTKETGRLPISQSVSNISFNDCNAIHMIRYNVHGSFGLKVLVE